MTLCNERCSLTLQEIVAGALEKRLGDVVLDPHGVDSSRRTDHDGLTSGTAVPARQVSSPGCVVGLAPAVLAVNKSRQQPFGCALARPLCACHLSALGDPVPLLG